MPAIRIGTESFLDFNPTYGVLICRSCQYAIQKSAVSSHLLRHKVYRSDRQQILSDISRLTLFEPDDVPLPHPTASSIPGIPVISGLRCTRDHCGYLCQSSKRMAKHCAETHSDGDPSADSTASAADAVKLQTFFRGTKLKYFVVADPTLLNHSTSDLTIQEALRHEPNSLASLLMVGQSVPPVASLSSSINQIHNTTDHEYDFQSTQGELDLQSLVYFHHFSADTVFTLPDKEHRTATQWLNIIPIALRRQWCMSGILALAACHMGISAPTNTTQRSHFDQVGALLAGFGKEYDSFSTPQRVQDYTESETKVIKQLKSVLDCACWALEASVINRNLDRVPTVPFTLASLIFTIRNMVAPDLQSPTIPHSRLFIVTQTFILVDKLQSMSKSGPFADNQPVLFDSLRALPSRMRELFAKPDDVLDVFVTLSAINALFECCDIAYNTTHPIAALSTPTLWLSRIPEQFHNMVTKDDPSALLVMGYWAVLLVNRATACGAWYLVRMAQTLLSLVADRLPNNPDIVDLVPTL